MYYNVLHEEGLNMETTTLTIRVDKQVKEQLDTLAKSMSRSKAYLPMLQYKITCQIMPG